MDRVYICVMVLAYMYQAIVQSYTQVSRSSGSDELMGTVIDYSGVEDYQVVEVEMQST